jgi:hypothetical protein
LQVALNERYPGPNDHKLAVGQDQHLATDDRRDKSGNSA